MAAITAFPDILGTEFGTYGLDATFTASENILAGQVVQLKSGATTIEVADKTSPAAVLGVALDDIVSGQTGHVRMMGAAVVANGDGATAITCGAELTVSGFDGAVKAFTAGTATTIKVGIAIDPIAAGGTGRMLIQIVTVPKAGA